MSRASSSLVLLILPYGLGCGPAVVTEPPRKPPAATRDLFIDSDAKKRDESEAKKRDEVPVTRNAQSSDLAVNLARQSEEDEVYERAELLMRQTKVFFPSHRAVPQSTFRTQLAGEATIVWMVRLNAMKDKTIAHRYEAQLMFEPPNEWNLMTVRDVDSKEDLYRGALHQEMQALLRESKKRNAPPPKPSFRQID